MDEVETVEMIPQVQQQKQKPLQSQRQQQPMKSNDITIKMVDILNFRCKYNRTTGVLLQGSGENYFRSASSTAISGQKDSMNDNPYSRAPGAGISHVSDQRRQGYVLFVGRSIAKHA